MLADASIIIDCFLFGIENTIVYFRLMLRGRQRSVGTMECLKERSGGKLARKQEKKRGWAGLI